MSKIVYKGKTYPTKTFSVMIDDEPREIKISVQSLSDAMGDLKEKHNSREETIDSEIYFYVESEDVLNLPDEEIAKNHLDESFEMIE